MGILSAMPVADDVEKKVTDLAVAAIFRGFKYIFCYKSLAKDFKSKIENLNNEKDRMKIEVDKERNNGKQIHADVLQWQIDVEKIQKKSDLSPSFKCIKCLPIPNPISRLRLGREAVQKSKMITELTDSATKLFEKEIAYLPQPSEDVPNTNTVFQDFPSREEAYGELRNQLQSEDCLILGIYGMPGVGKTLMMQQLWKEAQGQKKKIFEKVTLAVVGSATVDVIDLQDQLASGLNCDLVSKDDTKKRADQLKRSMMSSGKVLVIFDDVWGEISICDIIGFVDDNNWKGCKILFTSREKSHCSNNKCKDPVEITKLEYPEVLYMFKNTIGTDDVDSPPDESIVQEVCRKCAGLPLIIHAVGKALKCKSSPLWKDALTQLENCNLGSIEGIDQNIYACLKLSFGNLSKDAKQCLLLCSLLDADEYINIDSLSDIAEGSQLVRGGSTKVHAMVATLKSASLLLVREDEEENFRLHDIIRDVARSVAVKEHAFFIERCARELPGNSADYGAGKVLLLELEKDDFHFHPDLECPSLRTLWLVAPKRTEQERPCKINIPKFQADMFSNLRFLMLQRLCWRQHLNLQSFNKLRTLIVADCNLVEVDVNCFPESLETLCIWSCDLPANVDLAKLIKLRKLEIIYGRNELRIVPNTISSLSYLEELHLQILSWDDCTRTLMPKFTEISKLTCLTSLMVYWSDFKPSQDTSVFCKLGEYDIRVGVLDRKYKPVPHVSAKKRIDLTGKLQFEGFQNLVERAEIVILRDTNVNISRILDSNKEAFRDLRKLYIEVSDSMEYLACTSPCEIQSQLSSWLSFSNLTTLRIRGCSAMKYLFNNFVAEHLVQLQDLHISDCDLMEAIVMNEGERDGNPISFSKLKSLHLLSLSKLKTFYREKKDMHSCSTSMMDNSVIPSVQPRPLFDGMVAFPSLEEFKISGLNYTVSDIWGKNYYGDNVSSSFWKLERLKVSKCSGLKNVFQHSPMASHLIMHLKKMNVSSCKMMREIIGTDEREEITDHGKFGIVVFPELTHLKLVDLPDLSRSWCCQSGEANTYKVQFPVLLKLKLEALNIDLEQIEFGRDDSFCQLTILILSCDGDIQLPSGWQLPLYNLESLDLRHCFSDVLKSQGFFRRLKFLRVDELECSTLFSLSVLTSLEQLQGLVILNCGMLEEIVEDAKGDKVSGMDKKTITLFNLQSVFLNGLPNLKSFIHGANYELHMPSLVHVGVGNCGLSTLFTCSVLQELKQLEDLVVFDCGLLEGIVADTRSIEASDTNDKIITLPKLSLVKLDKLPNLKSFIHGANYELDMPALVDMGVVNCGLSTLFTCSVLQKLKQLKELSVDSCQLLEGIVADKRCIETSDTNDKIITLPRLSSVKLDDLPNLKSFIHGTYYELHMPALVGLRVVNCGLSTLFTCSVLQKLKQLKELSVDSCQLLEGIVADKRCIETCDTNDKIITLPQLSSVKLERLPNLKSFIHGVNYELHMPALKGVKVANCLLTTLFPCSVFQTLQQLKWLVVYECKLLECIVGDAKGIKTSDTKIITLPELSFVLLKDLPNFKSFSLAVGYASNMPMLLEFRLFSCPRMRNVTSLKTGTRLVHVYSEWHDGEEVPDLDDYLRQYRKLCDSAKSQALNASFFSFAWSCPWAC